MPEPESKLDPTASKDGILSGQTKETDYEVFNVLYSKHYKKNGSPDDPPTLRVDYEVGINTFVQKWVCPEHKGWAWSNKFVPWWTQRSNMKPPTTVDEALYYANFLAVPRHITVIETAGQRFAEIVEHDFTEKPELPEGNYEQPQTCGDCGLFDKGDCPHRVGMFGEESACEHFIETQNVEIMDDDVPF
jgi:DNA repair protein RadD